MEAGGAWRVLVSEAAVVARRQLGCATLDSCYRKTSKAI
jgi:hypothetical protein